MNSSKLRGSLERVSVSCNSASGVAASRMPSAQQSFTAPGLQAAPLLLPFVPFAPLALPFGFGFNEPKRASIVPTMHSLDRKSTRLNSSHQKISYAVFCLKKKKMKLEGAERATESEPQGAVAGGTYGRS